MNPIRIIESVDLEKLDRFASQVVSSFPTRMVIGLVGTLGAGKTTLVQRIAFHLGLDPSEVTSPTFTLLRSYPVESNAAESCSILNHLDAYRLADEDEFWELGVDELFEQNGWTLVEWADRVESAMPENTLWIQMTLQETDLRQLELTTTDIAIGSAIETLNLDP